MALRALDMLSASAPNEHLGQQWCAFLTAMLAAVQDIRLMHLFGSTRYHEACVTVVHALAVAARRHVKDFEGVKAYVFHHFYPAWTGVFAVQGVHMWRERLPGLTTLPYVHAFLFDLCTSIDALPGWSKIAPYVWLAVWHGYRFPESMACKDVVVWEKVYDACITIVHNNANHIRGWRNLLVDQWLLLHNLFLYYRAMRTFVGALRLCRRHQLALRLARVLNFAFHANGGRFEDPSCMPTCWYLELPCDVYQHLSKCILASIWAPCLGRAIEDSRWSPERRAWLHVCVGAGRSSSTTSTGT